MFARMATERKTCTCSAATNLLFCRYKPFVLLLQAVCSVATSHLYCRYKPLVLPLQAACSWATNGLVAHCFVKKPIARDAVCVAEVSACAHNG